MQEKDVHELSRMGHHIYQKGWGREGEERINVKNGLLKKLYFYCWITYLLTSLITMNIIHIVTSKRRMSWYRKMRFIDKN